ncbi:MAG: hypothetical protein D3924_17145 [Candidatus Electrothrix sp. AR4]|nr:hypothetical protein [Candidatus Electrothrix sp. AR4]
MLHRVYWYRLQLVPKLCLEIDILLIPPLFFSPAPPAGQPAPLAPGISLAFFHYRCPGSFLFFEFFNSFFGSLVKIFLNRVVL